MSAALRDIGYLRRELDTAKREYEACWLRDTSQLSDEQRIEADIDYARAVKRKRAAEDAYWNAINASEDTYEATR